MVFPREYYDAETLDLMTCVLESAWHDVEHLIHGRDLDCVALRTVMSASGSWPAFETGIAIQIT